MRGYHGDWIPERRFKRWFVPEKLPRFEVKATGAGSLAGGAGRSRIARAASSRLPLSRFGDVPSGGSEEPGAESRVPTASLFMRDVERRLDVVVFRSCFAKSAYQARALVVQGHVKLNGFKVRISPTITLRASVANHL